MTTITPLPTPPARTQDAATFITNADNFMAALPVFATQASAVGTEVNNNATIAATAASSATSSALAAAQSAGVIAWVSGTTYAIGNSRYSPITYQSYRRKTDGAGTVDPSADGTNWALIVQYGEAFSNVVGIAATFSLTTANLGQLVKVSAAGGIITLPPIASAPAGSTIALIAQFATGSLSVKGSASESIVTPAGTSFNSLPLNAGDQVQYVSNGVSWDEAYSCTPMAPVAGMRNRIINGGMQIAQRGTTGPAAQYTLDRFFTNISGTAPTYTQGLTAISGIASALNTMQINGIAGNSALNFYQRIEAANSWDLAGQIATFSYWVYQTTGATVNCISRFSYANTSDNFSSVTVIAASSGTSVPTGIWTKVTFTQAIPAAATTGIQVEFWCQNTPIVAGQLLIFTGVQLELGSVATPFEQRPYGLELSLCQRYYYQVAAGTSLGTGMYRTTIVAENLTLSLPTTLRINPTMSVNSLIGSSIYVNGASTPATAINGATVQSKNTFVLSLTSAAQVQNSPAWVSLNSNVLFNAEL